jgi:hypothetical protein
LVIGDQYLVQIGKSLDLQVGLKHETQQMRWVALSLNPTKQEMDKVLGDKIPVFIL